MKILLFLLISISVFAKSITQLENYNKYDLHFKKHYHTYFYAYEHIYDWHILKAQSIQESRLKDNAKSYVGAYGLMQFMPKTEELVAKDLKIKEERPAAIPALAIQMGAYYDRNMFNLWKSKRTVESRYKLMFASYNAGAGSLLKAQKRCIKDTNETCAEYNDIEQHLHKITGKYAAETKGYNVYIFKYYNQMKGDIK